MHTWLEDRHTEPRAVPQERSTTECREEGALFIPSSCRRLAVGLGLEERENPQDGTQKEKTEAQAERQVQRVARVHPGHKGIEGPGRDGGSKETDVG